MYRIILNNDVFHLLSSICMCIYQAFNVTKLTIIIMNAIDSTRVKCFLGELLIPNLFHMGVVFDLRI